MAHEETKITFYDINQCGLYKWGENDHPRMGSIVHLLEDLQAWGAGKPLEETKVFEPAEGSEIMPIYLFDIRRADNFWLVVMWNETPSSNGKVASVRRGSNVGNADVVLNDVEEDTIPGFATYFCFFPGLEAFCTIQFQHLVTGQKPMQVYMENFISAFSRYVVIDDEAQGEDIRIRQYRVDERDEPARLHAKFRASIHRNPGMHDFILARHARIRKVERKTSLSLRLPEDLAFWQSALRAVNPFHERQDLPDEQVRIKFETQVSYSHEELSALIENWVARHDVEWDDYGFSLVGETKVYWLSDSLARVKIMVEVQKDNDEVVNADSLVAALNGSHAQLVGVMS